MISIFWLALWLQMSAQAQINAKDFKMSDCNKPGMTCTIADGWKSPAPPAAPAIGHIECWNDDATKHFSCMSPKGSILDVESALNKLDENTWSNEGNGGGDLPSHFLAEAAQRAADETDGKPPKIEWIQTTDPASTAILPWTSAETPKGPLTTQHNHIERGEFVEPVDVSAVQVTVQDICDYEPSIAGKRGTLVYCSSKGKQWSCADKSRILEHDENSPPKYWCRKVQP